jgi:hypothetical protein
LAPSLAAEGLPQKLVGVITLGFDIDFWKGVVATRQQCCPVCPDVCARFGLLIPLPDSAMAIRVMTIGRIVS